MKKTIKYALLLLVLALLAFLDSCIFKNFRTSLVLCISFCLYKKDSVSIKVCALFGLFCDMIGLTLPFFSLIYLYLALLCLWLGEMFLGLNFKKVFFVSFFIYLIYYIAANIINVIAYGQVFISLWSIFNILAFSLAKALLSLFIYFIFKRSQF